MDEDEQLMAVLLGRPAPSGGTAAVDEYAAAERDMAVVQRQLHRIGDGLARHAADGPATSGDRGEPVRKPRRPRSRTLLFALAASVAVAVLGTGTAYFVAHNGAVDGGGASAKLTPEGIVACSEAVAEGTVLRVEPLGGDGRFRVVMDVDRYYKPRGGKPELSFTTEGAETTSYYRTGAKMLVVVSRFPAEGPETFREGDPAPAAAGGAGHARDALDWGRQWVERALPGAKDLPCPAE